MSGSELIGLVSARRRLERIADLELPSGVRLEGLLIGEDTQEAVILDADQPLTVTQLRGIHRSRSSGTTTPLILASVEPSGVRLLGPHSGAEPTAVLEGEHAARIISAVLGETTASAARTRLSALLKALDQANELPGVDSSGLFAIHYLETSVRSEVAWNTAVDQATPLLGRRAEDLIEGLGFTAEAIGDGARLLSPKEGPARAVAVLIGEEEGFEVGSKRLGSSPVQYGLSRAVQQRVPVQAGRQTKQTSAPVK
jgi:hypothetical protein